MQDIEDGKMRSVWLCSRNDVIANPAVLLAALGVALTGSPWPDIAVGRAIGALFMLYAVQVIRAGLRPVRLRAPNHADAASWWSLFRAR
jgi:Co/Zn/Cd efflux system component